MISRRFNGSSLIASLDALDLGQVDTAPPPRRTRSRFNDTQPRPPRVQTLAAPTAQRQATTITLPTLKSYSYKEYPKTCIVYTTNEEEANELIDGLKPGAVAMDLEWTVKFLRTAGQREHKASLVQIADNSGLVLLIQINNMRRFPARLQALVENPNVAKVGVNILNDGKKLFRDYGILAKNLVELGAVALVVDPAPIAKRKIVSLAKLVGHYCQRTLEKGDERTSDWEKPLNAANDAHSSLMVYNELLNLARIHSCSLDGDVRSRFASNVTWPLENTTADPAPSDEKIKAQHLRAYNYWYLKKLSLEDMCRKLSLKGKGYYGSVPMTEDDMALKPGTVITYIVSALQNKPQLEFQLEELVELIQMDLHSWSRHSAWILKQNV